LYVVYLGQSKKGFGEICNVLHIFHGRDTVFDCLGVLCAGGLKDRFNAADMAIGPVTIGFAEDLGCAAKRNGYNAREGRRKNETDFCEVAKEDERANCDNSLLVHDVELMGNGSCEETRAK
jgi:hypothetical protein